MRNDVRKAGTAQLGDEDHSEEVARGDRFTFGKNWKAFLEVLTPSRVEAAEESFRAILRLRDLTGFRFLDIGSGSGLSSLVARRLGAQVTSFDFDPQSVACTNELRRRYFPDDPAWSVLEGSVLDEAFMQGLGKFDIVYSWGVLHHTGQMWKALQQAANRTAPGGLLFIALYNDQGKQSKYWLRVKQAYNRRGRLGKAWLTAKMVIGVEGRSLVINTLRLRPWKTVREWKDYEKQRGMSKWHDYIDWVGGLPFEVATVDAVVHFLAPHGFLLERLQSTQGGGGNNQFVFRAPGQGRVPALSISSPP